MNVEQTGSFLAKLRKQKNLTQKELAKMLGVSAKTVSEWERGVSNPDISLLDDLARILDTTILELLRGKELEKEEIIENKALIETMKYAAMDTKNKIKRKFSNGCVLVVCLCLVLLVSFNVKGIYYLNRTYKTTDTYIADDLFTEVEAYVEIILNNQGRYTDEEYKEILKYVEAIRDFNSFDEASVFFYKDGYKYEEIKNYIESLSVYAFYGYSVNTNDSIYHILLSYDINKANAMSAFIGSRNECVNLLEELYEFVEVPYYNGNVLDIDPAYKLKMLILNQFYSYKTALKDIIEVGGLNA